MRSFFLGLTVAVAVAIPCSLWVIRGFGLVFGEGRVILLYADCYIFVWSNKRTEASARQYHVLYFSVEYMYIAVAVAVASLVTSSKDDVR
jgi:ammonia channel protein AmtB